uniref:CUB domain-containing protein n=1 Tax=Ficedula albicollis TaxID=59894 RepID=A0A803VN10_FICAL
KDIFSITCVFSKSYVIHAVNSFPFLSAAPYLCGGSVSDSSGVLQSPNYPGSYPNDADCVWEIQVENNFLNIDFLGKYHSQNLLRSLKSYLKQATFLIVKILPITLTAGRPDQNLDCCRIFYSPFSAKAE